MGKIIAILLIALILISVKAFANKVAALAVLLYYTDNGQEPPNDEVIKKYTQKAVKKLLHMPS